MSRLQEILEKYDYSYPEDLIAMEPVSPRDSAKLLVYNRQSKRIEESTFLHLIDFLPPNSLIIFNETKVLPARMVMSRESGGRVKALIVGISDKYLKIMADRSLKEKEELRLGEACFKVSHQEEKYFFLEMPSIFIKNDKVDFSSFYLFLGNYGDVPLPPYIKTNLSREELLERYQTVFARNIGSVAAPTASLHFTNRLLDKIIDAGHEIRFVTLHVGLGTFAPLTEENIDSGSLHREYFQISEEVASVITNSKRNKRSIIAVGTTATRALESAFDENGNPIKLFGETDIFIKDNYQFKVINGLITNFHVPKSSLMMLVSSFLGDGVILNLYKYAISKKFRLFSFGDGMFIK